MIAARTIGGRRAVRRASPRSLRLGGRLAAALLALLAPASARASSPLGAIESEVQSLCARLRASVASVEAWGAGREVLVGSGVVVDSAGTIVTTASVVRGAEGVVVRVPGAGAYPARVLGTDAATNLAILLADRASGLAPAPFSSETSPPLGSWVMILGNSFGSGPTVSVGILAGRRPLHGIDDREGLLQVNAPVNPGDSGAPLVNARGEVIGILCAALTPSQRAEPGALVGGRRPDGPWSAGANVGFAVPIHVGRDVARHVREHGRMVRGFLGLQIRPAAEGERRAPEGERSGLLVTGVLSGGPAERAGILAGDLLVEVNGEPVGPARDLQRAVARFAPDTPIEISVARGDTILILVARVGVMPDSLPRMGFGDVGRGPAAVPPEGSSRATSRLRARIETLEKEIAALRADLRTLEETGPR